MKGSAIAISTFGGPDRETTIKVSRNWAWINTRLIVPKTHYHYQPEKRISQWKQKTGLRRQ